jgi:hypothetical protein
MNITFPSKLKEFILIALGKQKNASIIETEAGTHATSREDKFFRDVEGGITLQEPGYIPTYSDACNSFEGVRACYELEENMFNSYSKNSTFAAILNFGENTIPSLLRLRVGAIDGETNYVISIMPTQDVLFGSLKIRVGYIYHLQSTTGSQYTDTQNFIVKSLRSIPHKSPIKLTGNNIHLLSNKEIRCFNIAKEDCNFILDRELGHLDLFNLASTTVNHILASRLK